MTAFRLKPLHMGAVALALILTIAGALDVAFAQRRARQASEQPHRSGEVAAYEALRREANANTVTLVSGNFTGSYLRYATDIAGVLDEPGKLRVLPIVTAGAVQNITDIMFMRGIDMGFVRTDSIEAIKRKGAVGNVERDVQYIARLVDDEMHVIASNDITDIRQLAGKKVNMDVIGSGTHFSSELIFERLGIKVEITSYEQNVAYEKLKAGEIDASIFFGGKPVLGFVNFSDPQRRFHLVPVRYEQSLEDYYIPATLSGKEYPNLLRADETIDTISVPTILAVYNLHTGNDRYERVTRFVDAFFSKLPELQKPPRHPKWKEVNLAATVPGLTRFKPAQDWLDAAARGRTTAAAPAPQDGRADQVERFKRFVQERRGRSGKPLSDEDAVRMFREYQEWSGSR